MTDEERDYLVRCAVKDSFTRMMMEGHTGGNFLFWVGDRRRTVSYEDVRLCLAIAVLQGAHINACSNES